MPEERDKSVQVQQKNRRNPKRGFQVTIPEKTWKKLKLKDKEVVYVSFDVEEGWWRYDRAKKKR